MVPKQFLLPCINQLLFKPISNHYMAPGPLNPGYQGTSTQAHSKFVIFARHFCRLSSLFQPFWQKWCDFWQHMPKNGLNFVWYLAGTFGQKFAVPRALPNIMDRAQSLPPHSLWSPVQLTMLLLSLSCMSVNSLRVMASKFFWEKNSQSLFKYTQDLGLLKF